MYMFFFVLVVILVSLALLLSFLTLEDEDKMSSFECGFISFQGSRLTFSLQFFLVAIIFLIFDVEIALILPLPLVTLGSSSLVVMMVCFVFLVVVLGGLYYEWGAGVLDWAY
nr:NADH dehydrogenase subunit 3 [Nedyopus patrioticus patrioticus]